MRSATEQKEKLVTRPAAERLAAIIARAAPPDERAADRFFLPRASQDDRRVQKLVQKWVTVSGNDSDHCARSRKTLLEDFEAGLREVSLRDPDIVPDWAAALKDLIKEEGQATGGDLTAGLDLPQAEAIAMLLLAPREFLSDAVAKCGLTALPGAINDMLAVFARRLIQLTGPVLEFELRLAATNAELFNRLGGKVQPSVDGTIKAWVSRLERFPGLAYLIGSAYLGWRRWMGEIIERLAADQHLLATELFSGTVPSEITGFKGDAGDVHAGGRTVAILTLARGLNVVYKPKDLRCAAAFQNLVGYLNSHGLSPYLHVRRIIPRGTYAWEEFVEHKPCANTEEIERFYVRMGMTIRLLQLLEGRDFWLDNLLAHGEHPVFIDLETILQPRVEIGALSPNEKTAREALEESAVQTSAIAMPTPITPGVAAEDYGALATPRAFITPYRRGDGPANANGKQAKSGDFFTWFHPEHAPVLNGQPADASEFFDSILTGYRAMQDCLSNNQSGLLATGSPISEFFELPVRFIYRDTWTYHKISRGGLAPGLLADPAQREIFLSQLFRPIVTGDFDGDSISRHVALIQSEIESLRRLDVPFFTSLPNSDSVFRLDGAEVKDYFHGLAADRLRDRIKNLDLFNLEWERDLIASCFATGDRKKRTQTTSSPSSESVPGRFLSQDQMLGQAIGIAETILADSFVSANAARGADTSPGPQRSPLAWIGLVYRPHMALLSLEVLQPDLLTGTCGLAILFSDLYRVTCEPRWKAAAMGALASTLKAAQDFAGRQNPAASNLNAVMPQFQGAFVGIGAQIYTLHYCGRALGDSNLESAAIQLASHVRPDPTSGGPGSTDSIAGQSGLVLSLSALGDRYIEYALSAAKSFASALGDDLKFDQQHYPRHDFRTQTVVSADAALAVALARLLRAQAPRSGMAEDREYLASVLGTLVQRLLDGSERSYGRNPDLLALFEILGKGRSTNAALAGASPTTAHQSLDQICSAHPPRFGGEDATQDRTSRDDISRVLAETDRLLSCGKDGDPMGLLETFELATAAFQATGAARYQEFAGDCLRKMKAVHDSTGRWFPNSFAADRHELSIVWGLSAMARAFLRASDHARVPSIRILGTPCW